MNTIQFNVYCPLFILLPALGCATMDLDSDAAERGSVDRYPGDTASEDHGNTPTTQSRDNAELISHFGAGADSDTDTSEPDMTDVEQDEPDMSDIEQDLDSGSIDLDDDSTLDTVAEIDTETSSNDDPVHDNEPSCDAGTLVECIDGDGCCPDNCAGIDDDCCLSDDDQDSDGTPDCKDQCPLDPTRVKEGDCGCPSSPKSASTTCDDGVCAMNKTCDGAGNCGSISECQPGPNCEFREHFAQKSKGYFFCKNGVKSNAATSRCTAQGLILVRIDSAQENAFLTETVNDIPEMEEAWIGANRRQGNWVWTNNGDAFYNNDCMTGMYCSTMDLSGGVESCMTINQTGTWHDDDCGSLFGGALQQYICESP